MAVTACCLTSMDESFFVPVCREDGLQRKDRQNDAPGHVICEADCKGGPIRSLAAGPHDAAPPACVGGPTSECVEQACIHRAVIIPEVAARM